MRRQDEEAAREMFQQLHPLVLKVVRSHLPRRMSEEDLVQTVFMKVFANLNQYSAKAPFEHWVARITVNTCIKALRAEKARPELRRADLTEEQEQVLDVLVTGMRTCIQTETWRRETWWTGCWNN